MKACFILFFLSVVTVLSAKNNIQNDTALLMYFDFELVEGDTVFDKSANAYKGVIKNKNLVEGIRGKALSFDNTNISIPNVKQVSEHTAMAWIKIPDYGTSAENLLIFEKSSAFYMNILSVTKGNKTRGRLRVGGHFEGEKPWRFLDTPTDVPVNEWFHAAYTLKEGVYTIYINGQQVADGAGNPNLIETDFEFTWGALWKGSQNRYKGWFKGYMDECIVLSRALNTKEIEEYFKTFK